METNVIEICQYGDFDVIECPRNEIEKIDIVQSYASEWRKAFVRIPQDLGIAQNLALAKKFSPTAKQHEKAISETLAEIRNRRVEILRPAPDKLAVAETLDRAERMLNELLLDIKSERKATEDRVKDETERRKKDSVDLALQKIKETTIKLFNGPLSVISLKESSGRLMEAGKGKKTPETFADAVNAAAETIISERIELAGLCNTNLELINAADLPAVSAVKESLMQRPTSEVQTVIARRKAEAELAEAKKKAAAQREPEKLAELKLQVAEIKSLPHMTNWKNRHQNDLSHPEDQAELWQFFGRLYEQIESKFKPPQTAYTQQPVHVVSELKPEVPEVKPIQQPSPPAREMIGRPSQMPQAGFAFEMSFHCGTLDEAGTKQLYSQICDLVEVAGGTVISVKKI